MHRHTLFSRPSNNAAKQSMQFEVNEEPLLLNSLGNFNLKHREQVFNNAGSAILGAGKETVKQWYGKKVCNTLRRRFGSQLTRWEIFWYYANIVKYPLGGRMHVTVVFRR